MEGDRRLLCSIYKNTNSSSLSAAWSRIGAGMFVSPRPFSGFSSCSDSLTTTKSSSCVKRCCFVVCTAQSFCCSDAGEAEVAAVPAPAALATVTEARLALRSSTSSVGWGWRGARLAAVDIDMSISDLLPESCGDQTVSVDA